MASGQPCCRGWNTNTMLRFAANIGGGHVKRLFSEYPFRERFDRAAAAGFEAVEFPEPYGEDVHAIRAALTRNGLRQVQFNLPWGDHAAGEVGIANNPRRRVELRDGVSRALSRGLVRSTIGSCSTPSTGPASTVGSAQNTCHSAAPRPRWAGCATGDTGPTLDECRAPALLVHAFT